MTIVAKDLMKSYGKRVVVNKVSMEVHRGEVVGLLGPNGAGKTTTFSLIVGLEKTEAGVITLDGVDVTNLPMYRRGQLGVAYLPQEPSVFRKLTVEENIISILERMGLPPKVQMFRLRQLIQEFRLEHVAKQKGGSLSGGERRRTEIARALAQEPSFLLLDEPFAGIDPLAVAEIQQLVMALSKRQIGILITDHNVRETLRITDRAYILREGEILVAGTAAEVSANPLAKRYYLGEGFEL